ncbi:hypothetical protein [Neptuniibacter sp. QD57_21]|uniref:hypothetical protein n=1 Tax=Neptuniibacter sp. QD57_21 TaxID=3398213 RepID=UPI0039F5B9B4
MQRHLKLSSLLLGGLLLSGCDSSYHAFDGKSGFSFTPINSDEYSVEYIGDKKSSQKDVETMWHHAARELCRGGAYQHQIFSRTSEKQALKQYGGGNILPPESTTYQVKGDILCLAPNLANKAVIKDRVLLGKHFSSDQLESGSATN